MAVPDIVIEFQQWKAALEHVRAARKSLTAVAKSLHGEPIKGIDKDIKDAISSAPKSIGALEHIIWQRCMRARKIVEDSLQKDTP